MTSPISVDELTVVRSGTRVLDRVTFDLRPGRITGFLGPNGAGKTTTLRAVAGLDRPTSGTVLVDGRPLTDWPRPWSKVWAVLGHGGAHRRRTVLDHLRWVARIVGADDARCVDALTRVGLGDAGSARAGTLSFGMQQRLGLATTLLVDSEIVLLDEPMNGLDAEGIDWLRTMLLELRSEGRTLFVSSHLLKEMEEVVDDLVILASGAVVHASSMQEFVERFEQSVVVVRCDDPDRLVVAVEAAGGTLVRRVESRLTCTGIDADVVGALARTEGIAISELSVSTDLSGAYRAATRDRAATGVDGQ